MKITLISQEIYDKLRAIQRDYPALTYQNKGYDYIDKSKFTEQEAEAFRQVTAILKEHIAGFKEFNNFRLRADGIIEIRVQYNYNYNPEWGIPFVGVGYLKLDELINGFDEPATKEE